MACSVTLSDVTYSCDDLGVGGITELYLVNKVELTNQALEGLGASDVVFNADTREITGTVAAIALGDGIEVEFNNKDGFSFFGEVKTVNADGTTSTVPTISFETPKMTPEKVKALNQMAKGGSELVALVATAAKTYHVVGYDYGLYINTVDGNSGTARAEKNRFQVTLTGEEDGLSYTLAETTDDNGKDNFDTLVSLIKTA